MHAGEAAAGGRGSTPRGKRPEKGERGKEEPAGGLQHPGGKGGENRKERGWQREAVGSALIEKRREKGTRGRQR
jgi:hypothetical protein